jgi:hypothetical protein
LIRKRTPRFGRLQKSKIKNGQTLSHRKKVEQNVSKIVNLVVRGFFESWLLCSPRLLLPELTVKQKPYCGAVYGDVALL